MFFWGLFFSPVILHNHFYWFWLWSHSPFVHSGPELVLTIWYEWVVEWLQPGPENKNCCLDEISIRYGASHEEITKCFNYYLIVVKDVSMDDFVSGSYIFIAIVRT